MKTIIAIALLILPLSQLGGADYSWSFPTSLNPAISETANPNALAIAPGPFSIGWVSALPFSTNQGFWDLGSAGTMAASFADDGNRAVIETVEWYDGAIYGTYAGVAITGGTLVQQSFDIYEPWPVVGKWVRHSQEFSLSSASWTMTITGATNGSVVGSVSVNTFKPDSVFGLWVESSDSMTGQWSRVSHNPLLLVTNRPGSLFYRTLIQPLP